MNAVYDIDLRGMKPMLERWSEQDPATPEEIERNEMIEVLQGNQNRFISN